MKPTDSRLVARLTRTLTRDEWKPLQALRWDAARASLRLHSHPAVHYHGSPTKQRFAIVGTEEEIREVLQAVAERP